MDATISSIRTSTNINTLAHAPMGHRARPTCSSNNKSPLTGKARPRETNEMRD
jgi:hypothetical protein